MLCCLHASYTVLVAVMAKSSSGRMSPVRGRTMKEYDQVSITWVLPVLSNRQWDCLVRYGTAVLDKKIYNILVVDSACQKCLLLYNYLMCKILWLATASVGSESDAQRWRHGLWFLIATDHTSCSHMTDRKRIITFSSTTEWHTYYVCACITMLASGIGAGWNGMCWDPHCKWRLRIN